MNLQAVIEQIKANCPLFGGRVAGAAEFAASKDQVWMDLPACYVIPLEESAGENTISNALRQLITEQVGVVVEFDNRADRRGQSVAETFEDMKAGIFAAVLNWRLDPQRAARGLEYAGSRLLDFDRARLFYQWDFSLTSLITDKDGWQVPAEPLTLIDASFDRAIDLALLAEAKITPPQP